MSLPPKVLLLCLALFIYISLFDCGHAQETEQSLSNELFRARGRRMLDIDLDDGDAEEDLPIKKKKPAPTATKKNQTKLIKPSTISTTGSSKNQTKLFKTSSSKNQTKLIKLNSNSLDSPSLSSKNKTKLIKPISKSSNSTKPSSVLAKKTSDLAKLSPPKNKTTKPPSTGKQSGTLIGVKSKNPDKIPSSDKEDKSAITQKPKQPSWIDQEDEDDLVSGFRDLPTRFQEQLLPDLERISTTSKVYLSKANKEMTKGFKPFVGNKYASTVASIVSFAFILIPLLLVSLVVNRIKAYFSVQKLVIFIQVYLSIYFSILCLSSLVTGLEPLRFFYSTSQSTYVCLQVLQTLGYVLYLLLLLMYLVLVFGTESGPGSKALGLVQTFVGFAVGLHYYVTVFHRVVLHQPPKTNWKVHGIYATCFLVICLLANADRRKKAYLEEGGEEGKKS